MRARLGGAWAALAVATVLAMGACSREEGATPEANAPRPLAETAPDFRLADLAGHEVALSSLRGKTVLIDFWATWCPPCELQIPILSEIDAAYRARGVQVLGVSVDKAGPEVVAQYTQKHGASYTILLGSEALARDFGVPGFPSLIVVAPDGTIHSRHVGLVEKADLERLLTSLLEGEAT